MAGRALFTLEQLQTFVAVAATEHVSRAASDLGITPGAVSQQLRMFEQAMGIALFTRQGRGLHLTDAGSALRPVAMAAVHSLADVERLPREFVDLERGSVRLAGSNLALMRAPLWVAGFLERHPRLDVRMHVANRRDALLAVHSDAIDCALLSGEPLDVGVESMVMLRSPLCVVVSRTNPLAGASALGTALPQHRYLRRGSGSATERLAERVLGRHYGRGPTIEVSAGAMRAAVLAGLGYAVMPAFAVEDDIREERLVVLRGVGIDDELVQEFTAVRRIGSHLPAATAFWAHLRSCAA